jgi:protein-L-isoaspartate(D-aspartate) O-methyltransferase
MREEMVRNQIEARGISDSLVLSAMKNVPRHHFVPEKYMERAYQDCPLPIGYNQTISQPYIVAYMTEQLKLNKQSKVLEIGTGSGYQAAILADIADSVFTIEIIPALAKISAHKLKELGCSNVFCKKGDGYNGWIEHAPFDAIIVTAAPTEIPQPLIDQLANGGKLIVPVGAKGAVQYLKMITKKNGKIKTRNLLAVRFVPFTRDSED